MAEIGPELPGTATIYLISLNSVIALQGILSFPQHQRIRKMLRSQAELVAPCDPNALLLILLDGTYQEASA
jgi:hypothetical protein